uniref:AIR synthase-related protein n=1 Tax=Helicobacter suis TaxID=104628 RepID=UPI002491760C
PPEPPTPPLHPPRSVANQKALSNQVLNHTSLPEILFYDAQTSGGLLAALREEEAKECVQILRDEGTEARIIGQCVPRKSPPLILF